jgi:hypothetical protein
LVTLL